MNKSAFSHKNLENDTLLRYSPDAIAQYYHRRPWLAIGRGIKIITYFTVFIIQLIFDKWFNLEEKNKLKRAEQIRKILTKLGPTFIKVGQALSTRPDLIRRDFLEELIKLQDKLPPFDNDLAFSIIERELDLKIAEAYKEISPQPIAAASLGQVYRGILHTGEEVAIKVQRPNLIPIITLDLYLMRWASHWIGPFLPLNLGHDLELIVDEFGTKLFEEIDYLNEARNAEKFAANFRDDPDVKVPAIYWRYTSKNVLTLEWINGYKLNDLDTIIAAGLNVDDIIRVGVTSGLKQLLEHGFFHADPHPGNLFAMPDGRMAYIDFGMMDQLTEEAKETIASSVVQLINRDYKALAEDFVKLGFLTPETDIMPIVPALEKVFGNAIGQSVSNFNFKTVTDDFSELMYKYPFRVPAKFALIIRSLVTQEGLALSLNKDFRIVEVSFPYVSRRLLTGESPAMRKRLLEVLFKDGKFQWERLENMIALARSDNRFNLLPTAGLGFQFLVSEEGEYLRHQLITALIEDDRLHTEEVKRLWALIQPELQPQKLWDVAFKAISQFSSELVTTR